MLTIGENVLDTSLSAALPDQNGKEKCLKDLLAEKGAVFYFYPRDSTPGCTLEANDFQSLGSSFSTLGYSVVGISKDSVKSHSTFCLKQGLTFTLLSDKEGTVCEQFGVWQEKKNYGRTSMGIVRSTFIIDAQGVVQKVYTKVKTKGHANEVLKSIQENPS